jgi:hypothetical protein
MNFPRASPPLPFEYLDFNLSGIDMYFCEVVITYNSAWIGKSKLAAAAAVNCSPGAEMAC